MIRTLLALALLALAGCATVHVGPTRALGPNHGPQRRAGHEVMLTFTRTLP